MIKRRVDFTFNSELIKFGRNVRLATCPGRSSTPLPALHQEGEVKTDRPQVTSPTPHLQAPVVPTEAPLRAVKQDREIKLLQGDRQQENLAQHGGRSETLEADTRHILFCQRTRK